MKLREKIKQFERTRHLQVWHDASDIAIHGHILFCINVLYDPAVFLREQSLKRNLVLVLMFKERLKLLSCI